MRFVGLLALVILVLAAPRGPAAGEEPQGDKVQKTFNDLYPVEFRSRVNAGIDRGRDWLLRAQRPDGTWHVLRHHSQYPMGTTALVTLTLLKCGVPADDPHIAKAFAYLRGLPMRSTYSVALLLMALDAKYAPARDPFEVEAVDRYGTHEGPDPCEQHIAPGDLAWMRAGVAWLTEQQTAEGTWRYPGGGFDLSNTQFALLGLHAGTRCGVKVKASVWLDALRALLAFQDKEGEPVSYKANEVRGRYRFEWTERAFARGFGYMTDRAEPSASMTTAGITSVVICQSRLWKSRGFTGELRADTRRSIRDAVAWLQQNFTVRNNPGGSDHWTTYYLYGLERAGILGRFRFLGLHDWYKEGADVLLEEQRPPGDWHGDGADTCFALLFLKRATSRMREPVITPSSASGGRMPETEPGPARAPATEPDPKTTAALLLAVAQAIRTLDSEDPDEAFLACQRLGRLEHLRAVAPLVRTLKRHADDDVRTAAAVALGRLRAAAAAPDLIDALTDPDALVRHAAEAALRRITGLRPPEVLRGADGHGDRLRIQKQWRRGWAENEDAVRARLGQPVVR